MRDLAGIQVKSVATTDYKLVQPLYQLGSLWCSKTAPKYVSKNSPQVPRHSPSHLCSRHGWHLKRSSCITPLYNVQALS